MYCPNCGTNNEEGAVRCESCLELLPAREGQAAQPTPPPESSPYHQTPQQYSPGPQPGYDPYAQQAAPPPRPSTFLAGNIILTVLSLCSCFGLITGIIGIVFSAMVMSRHTARDYEGARSASKVAKVMFFVTLALVIIGTVLTIAYLAWAVAYGSEIMIDYLDLYNYFN